MGNFSKKTITTDTSGKTTVVESQFTVKREIQNYFSLYVDALDDMLFNIKSVVEIKVFLALCKMAHFNDNEVPVTKAQKLKIAAMVDASYGSVENALTNLCKMGYVSKKDGNYTISHHLAWKGDTKTRLAKVNNTVKQVLQKAGEGFLETPNQNDVDTNVSEQIQLNG